MLLVQTPAFKFATPSLHHLFFMSVIHSMTGFANAQGETPLGLIHIELRCVNSRFLDITMRMPEELRPFEPKLQEIVKSRVVRGKFECRIGFLMMNQTAPSVNVGALQSLQALQSQILAQMPQAQPLRMTDILEYPGIVKAADVDNEAVEASLRAVMNQAMDAFDGSRSREGEALKKILEANCTKILETVDALAPCIPQIHEQIKAKLTERLEAALSEALSKAGSLTKEDVAERIRQEVTLYALRMDVAEEINRLRTHVAEVRRVLAAGGAAGRRLDFLTQEMNRESNTLGSKAASIEMTDAAISLKLSVDQMREQLQNIE